MNLKKNIRSNCNHKCWFNRDDNYFYLLAHILLVLIVLRSITAFCWHFGLIDSLDPLLSFLFLRNKSVFNFCVFDSCYLFTHSFIHIALNRSNRTYGTLNLCNCTLPSIAIYFLNLILISSIIEKIILSAYKYVCWQLYFISNCGIHLAIFQHQPHKCAHAPARVCVCVC